MKTNLDKFFKTDKELEQSGVWFDINNDVGFLLRPFKQTNPRVKAAMAKHYKPYARQIEMNTLSDEKAAEIQVDIFLDVCLVDWKGVEADDKPLEFTRENAKNFFLALPDLFDTLWKHAGDYSNYREDLGNS